MLLLVSGFGSGAAKLFAAIKHRLWGFSQPNAETRGPLDSCDFTPTAVAEAVGYDSEAAFSRAFK